MDVKTLFLDSAAEARPCTLQDLFKGCRTDDSGINVLHTVKYDTSVGFFNYFDESDSESDSFQPFDGDRIVYPYQSSIDPEDLNSPYFGKIVYPAYEYNGKEVKFKHYQVFGIWIREVN